MEDNKKKRSLLKAVRLNHRALRIWQSFCPGIFLSVLADSVFRALSPYVTLWLSARIIDELAGGRDPEQLLKLILIQLISAALLSLFGGILGRWKNYKMDSAGRLHDRIYIEKMLRLDYADLDRQYVYDLYAQIRQNDNWNGWGLRYTLYLFEELITAVIRILGGAGLTVSLFLSRVPADRSGLRILNHPLCMVLFIVLMLLTAVLSPVCA